MYIIKCVGLVMISMHCYWNYSNLCGKKVYFISAFNIYSELHVSYLVHTLVNMEINE